MRPRCAGASLMHGSRRRGILGFPEPGSLKRIGIRTMFFFSRFHDLYSVSTPRHRFGFWIAGGLILPRGRAFGRYRYPNAAALQNILTCSLLQELHDFQNEIGAGQGTFTSRIDPWLLDCKKWHLCSARRIVCWVRCICYTCISSGCSCVSWQGLLNFEP